MQSFLTDKHVLSLCSFISDVSRSECVCVHGYGSMEVPVLHAQRVIIRVRCGEGVVQNLAPN